MRNFGVAVPFTPDASASRRHTTNCVVRCVYVWHIIRFHGSLPSPKYERKFTPYPSLRNVNTVILGHHKTMAAGVSSDVLAAHEEYVKATQGYYKVLRFTNYQFCFCSMKNMCTLRGSHMQLAWRCNTTVKMLNRINIDLRSPGAFHVCTNEFSFS
jgi:hypothetical protein